MTLSDANSNAYTLSPGSPSSTDGNSKILWAFYILSAPANASKTLNFSWTGSSFWAVLTDDFSGNGGTVSFDNDAKDTGASGTTINTPSITPANSHSLLYAGATSAGLISAPKNGGTLGVWTGAGSFGANGNFGAEYDLDATGATAVQFTQATGAWAAMTMAFYVTVASTPAHFWVN